MKTLSTTLAGHLAQETLSLAQCWKITRRDGAVLGFTGHDADIFYEEVTYQAASGFTPSAVASQASLAVDNMDIEGVLDSAAITEADILAGRYDFAQVETFLVNYADLSQGRVSLRSGWLGEVQLSRQQFVAEVRGLTQQLSQHMGDLYSPVCRARFGDAKCGVDAATTAVSASVTSASSRSQFTASALTQPAGHFDGGVITFTSGANDGLLAEVKFFESGGRVSLALPMPYALSAGDGFSITTGCDKTITTCASRYDNALNFRGEPHVPGLDRMLQTATTH